MSERRRRLRPGPALAIAGPLALWGLAVGLAARGTSRWGGPEAAAQTRPAAEGATERGARAGEMARGPAAAPTLLRLRADSAVVGSYKFQTGETHRLSYELPEGDPRAEFLSSSAGPWTRSTEVALTMVSTPRPDSADRRYLVYWLGYRISGDEVRSLSAMQWDSIFRKVGRRAVLNLTPTGQVQNVEVGSDAVRPVGQALAGILGGMALDLPADPVDAGAEWHGGVAIPVRRPDGSRALTRVRVRYVLRRFEARPEGRLARIEFDGEPDSVDAPADSVGGIYFGEGIFAVEDGRFDRMRAEARIDVDWKAVGGLPASRSRTEWIGQFTRR